jgi:hypothetical protein
MAMGMDRFWVGTAEAASIDVYGTDGMRHGSIDIAVEPRAPTHRNFERAIEVRLSVASSRAVRELQRAEFEAMPMPERVPPYSGILVDSEELLWIVTSAPGDEQTTARVVDGDSREVATVVMPVELTITRSEGITSSVCERMYRGNSTWWCTR